MKSDVQNPVRAWLVVAAGGVAALQVGKLPPALPALQAELGLSLVQSGFLLSMVQLAGLSLAVFMGLLADGMGLKRSMVRGLILLALASAAPPVLAVPEEAVQELDGKKVVFATADGTTFAARPVELGRTANSKVEIVSGLKAGERIASAAR